MKHPAFALLTLCILPLPALAGEVFGTVRTAAGPVAEGTQVAAKCGANAYGPVATDRKGAYRLVIAQTGKCALTVTHDGKTAGIDIVSFDDAAQADITLAVDAAGALTARRG